MNQAQRMIFDALLEQVLASLPPRLHELLEEAPLVVEDRPSRHLLHELGLDHDDQSLCGLYTGVPLIERSVTEGVEPPESIQIFREGVVMQAGGWERSEDE
ncbi:MAG: metallopeptidase family protein, partial [Planctomycetota bacterium]|nr:metallopeptidase family protein [Planctomycetota bacterium]